MTENFQCNDPKWGSENRDIKAAAILKTLQHFYDYDLSGKNCLDIGCGNGEIASCLSEYFKFVAAVDMEPWSNWNYLPLRRANLFFLKLSAEKLSLKSNSIDIIICNQVYEHVENLDHLVDEIHRVLKPGGVCYFAGPNLIYPVEQHTYLPFVHWFDKKKSCQIMNFFGLERVVDANARTYWFLKRKFKKFNIENAVPYIISNPNLYDKKGFLWFFLSKIPYIFLNILTILSPGFVFILKKKYN